MNALRASDGRAEVAPWATTAGPVLLSGSSKDAFCLAHVLPASTERTSEMFQSRRAWIQVLACALTPAVVFGKNSGKNSESNVSLIVLLCHGYNAVHSLSCQEIRD